MILYDVIEYLEDCLENDQQISASIDVLEAYKYSHKLNNSELQVQIIDHSEFERYTTFEDGKVYVCPLQIDVYAKQMTIGNEIMSAQKAAYTLAQKVINWLNVNDVHAEIDDVISIKNGTYTSAVPVADVGTVLYRCVVRVDLYLETN